MTNERSATWADLAAAAPAIAAAARGVLYRRGDGEGLLATVRGDSPPRIHPVNVGVVDGGLYVFLLDSAKRRDLAEDGRYALHGHQDPAAPTEVSVRGRAGLVPAGKLRDRVAAGWFFEVDDSYWLFELRIDTAILGERAADEWPPRYTRWTASPR
ncbi:MAG: pyridoxamine 5'-phosphate oxidase family protein [Chloroflexota bacterium]